MSFLAHIYIVMLKLGYKKSKTKTIGGLGI